MTRRTDDLVSAARSGDESGWHGLYLLHSARITSLVRALPRSDWASSPEDVVAEAWLTAATKMADFDGSDEDFGGWLFTIARHHASNAHRTGARRQTQPTDTTTLDVLTERAEDPSDTGLVHDEAIAELLSHLSPREAEVVACIDVAGLDVGATAKALGMRPTAVRVARHRALGRLRAVLDDARAPEAADPLGAT
ncbi:RNA polymerase sigma factor [Nocardioides sp. C4-1]|uniref:RNA polymerase sigma factor n=1 Tax=Nocardioides sp. C4-1 TaxID=3151851 RepID=UPI003263E80F